MSRRIQTGSSIRRKSHHIGSEIRPKRIADVVGLRILADEDWKETGEELKKISKDTLNRLEKSYLHCCNCDSASIDTYDSKYGAF